MAQQIRTQRFVRPYFRELSGTDAPASEPRARPNRSRLSRAARRRRDFRPARPFQVPHSARRTHDRHREQFPDSVAEQLFRHRTPSPRRFVWRNHTHRRGAGAAHETARRRGARPLAHPSDRFAGTQQRTDIDRNRPVHGALLELNARSGSGRQTRRADADPFDKTP